MFSLKWVVLFIVSIVLLDRVLAWNANDNLPENVEPALSLEERRERRASSKLDDAAFGDACYLFAKDTEYIEYDLRVPILEKGFDPLAETDLVPFRIPQEYYSYWNEANHRGETTSIYIQVQADNFSPVYEDEAVRRNLNGIWNWMTVGFRNSFSLEKHALLYARGSYLKVQKSIDAYPLIPYDFGLLRIDHEGIDSWTDETSLSYHPDGTVFLAQHTDGSISDVFSCTPIKRASNPSCQHNFKYGQISVRITYLRKDLPNWRQIRANIDQFLSCATLETSEVSR